MGALAYPDFVLGPGTPSVVRIGDAVAAAPAVALSGAAEARSGMRGREIVTGHAPVISATIRPQGRRSDVGAGIQSPAPTFAPNPHSSHGGQP